MVLGGLIMGAMLNMRVAMTVSMISMVNHTALYEHEHPNSSAKDFFPADYKETGEFFWRNEIQQIIFSGYMVSYTIPQVFTTKWSMKYGLRLSIPFGLALCAISNLLIPVVSYWSWQWVLVMRLLNGLGASAILPSMVSCAEIWMPLSESSRGMAVFQFTSCVINALTPLVSGLLTSIHWKWAFHVPATVSLIICLIWYMIAADDPSSSKLISQKELELICGTANKDENEDEKKSKSKALDEKAQQVKANSALPWYFMFKIKTFYFLSLAMMIFDATCQGFLFLMPTYLNRVLQVPVEDIGLLNFVVQIGTMFCMLWTDPVCAMLQKTCNMGLTMSRRVVVFICMAAVIGTYTYIGLYHDNLTLVISINRFFHQTNDIMLILVTMSQFGADGLSGMVYSMVNTFGNMSVVLSCWAIGRVLDYNGESLECWSWILYSLAFLNLIYFFNFIFFCHSEPVHVKLSTEEKKDKRSVEDGGSR